MVKVEGTLDEMYELFGGNKKAIRQTSQKASRKPIKKASPKRPLNDWQKYVKNKKKQIKYKSGDKKGQLNLKAMSRAFKKTRKGKK